MATKTVITCDKCDKQVEEVFIAQIKAPNTALISSVELCKECAGLVIDFTREKWKQLTL